MVMNSISLDLDNKLYKDELDQNLQIADFIVKWVLETYSGKLHHSSQFFIPVLFRITDSMIFVI